MPETKTKTATFVKTMSSFTGDARLYQLSDPIVSTGWAGEPKGSFTYVIVSATVAPYTGAETYIFGADADGEVTEWLELDGSYRGGLDHAEALRGAGYEVAS